ncbi:MAG: hypothetical protein U1E14_03160 [Geminicoccaceae bacterium]
MRLPPLSRRAVLGGLSVAGLAVAGTAARAGDWRERLRPPPPLAALRVHAVRPEGRQRIEGGPDEDLLLVHPDGEITGAFQLEVDGFRGIYLIGASYDPAPMGWLTAPSGARAEGIGALLKLRTHGRAVRPFVYLARVRLRTSRIRFGDFLQVGGGAPAGAWEAWPDVYRHRILAEPLFGWKDHAGGSFSAFVSHSDFIKAELGGIRHGYAAAIDVTWGYQAEYVTPTYAFDFRPYAGPDGPGTLHYWDYVARMAVDPALDPDARPKAFFLSRASDKAAAGEIYAIDLHGADGEGRGVFVVPQPGSASIAAAVHPGKGAFAPVAEGDGLVWPPTATLDGRPVVRGRLIDGARVPPPVVVSEAEVGHAWRITGREALMAYIEGGYLA